MLTKLILKNFKKFKNIEIELSNPVVLIGPNNSGKTSALQALALWETGIKRWNEKRKNSTSEKRTGVAINRRDLVSIPIPNINLLWRGLHIRKGAPPDTKNIRVDIIVEGISKGEKWECGFEFDYANEESLYCRPLRLQEGKKPERMPIPEQADLIQIAFLPPMSGLSSNETRLDQGAINVRVGEGRTAEVLRNLCFKIKEENQEKWNTLKNQIDSLFGATLMDPEYIPERGEIAMEYIEKRVKLDISCSGRGLQQTLLLLSFMYANPGSVLLLDEPDAHLEILRQRQIYQILTETASENNNQIIAASHSEILLNEAANRDVVIAFVGKPHRIDDRGSQVLKSLREIGFEQYYQAEQTGWGLYLEGSTDLAILKSFAKKMNHKEAMSILERPYVIYVENQPQKVRNHYHGIKEGIKHFKGVALFDRLEDDLPSELDLHFLIWNQREIENYLCYPETLISYAKSVALSDSPGPLFQDVDESYNTKIMQDTITELENALKIVDKGSPWDISFKVSDDFLIPLFKKYFQQLNLPNLMNKKNFHELANYVPEEKLDPEIKEKLDKIVKIAKSAKTPESDY
jgi:AAA15 family ATPase/GTPase